MEKDPYILNAWKGAETRTFCFTFGNRDDFSLTCHGLPNRSRLPLQIGTKPFITLQWNWSLAQTFITNCTIKILIKKNLNLGRFFELLVLPDYFVEYFLKGREISSVEGSKVTGKRRCSNYNNVTRSNTCHHAADLILTWKMTLPVDNMKVCFDKLWLLPRMNINSSIF